MTTYTEKELRTEARRAWRDTKNADPARRKGWKYKGWELIIPEGLTTGPTLRAIGEDPTGRKITINVAI